VFAWYGIATRIAIRVHGSQGNYFMGEWRTMRRIVMRPTSRQLLSLPSFWKAVFVRRMCISAFYKNSSSPHPVTARLFGFIQFLVCPGDELVYALLVAGDDGGYAYAEGDDVAVTDLC